MLKNTKYKKNIFLNILSLMFIVFSGFCYSQESTQEINSSQLNSNSQIIEANQPPSITSPESVIQDKNNSSVNKLYSFLSPQDEPSGGKKDLSEPMDALSVSLGLIFILSLIFLLAWIMRKAGYGQFSGQGELSVLATLNLGQKEKIALIKVGQQQILVGVTASQINTLYVLDEKLDLKTPHIKNSQSTIEKNKFSAKLNEVLSSSTSRVKKL